MLFSYSNVTEMANGIKITKGEKLLRSGFYGET